MYLLHNDVVSRREHVVRNLWIIIVELIEKYAGRSNWNENLDPFRAQINLYERACGDRLRHV
jgi:hypothetical protein